MRLLESTKSDKKGRSAGGTIFSVILHSLIIFLAVFATARKLATLIYRLLRYGHPYVDEGAEAYEKRYREDRIKSLTAAVKALGFELTPKACDA